MLRLLRPRQRPSACCPTCRRASSCRTARCTRRTSAGIAQPAAFFAGCVMSTALADVDRATLRVLQRAGFSVSQPGPAGLLRRAARARRRLAARAAAGAGEYRRLRTARTARSWSTRPAAARCSRTTRITCAHDPAWAERARAFSARVRDLSEVLADRPLPIVDAGPGRASSIRTPATCCTPSASAASRAICCAAFPALALAEIDEAGLCCGSAGVYNVTNPVQSRQLQQRKLDNALAPDPAVIVTTNPGCLLQLQSGLAERGSRVQVQAPGRSPRRGDRAVTLAADLRAVAERQPRARRAGRAADLRLRRLVSDPAGAARRPTRW